MGLYDSELDINRSDSSMLSTISDDSSYYSEKKPRKKYKSKKDIDSDFPSSMPEDEDFQEEEEEDADENTDEDVDEDFGVDLDFDALEPKPVETPSYGMSRAEFRKMQEELTKQEGDAEHPNQMDLRVGKIVHIQPIGDGYSYISEVSLGEYDESRLIAMSLMDNYEERDLLNGMVVILCNVNPLDDREIRSKTGMLLLASKGLYSNKGIEVGEALEVIEPYHRVKPGSRVYVDEFPLGDPLPPTDEEFFDYAVKDFSVDIERQVFWKGLPLKIENYPDNKLVVRSATETFCRLG